MITYKLPRRIRYIPASAIFTATYNAPTIGKYDFNNNKQVFVEKLLPNTVYLIDSFSVAGTVASEDFLSAIDTVPLFTLAKSLNNEHIFDVPIQLQNYFTDRQIVHFFTTGLNNCGLVATISGKINQIAQFIGIAEIKLSVNISIHAIDESDFEKTLKAQG
jgi:hypothetical protein